MKKSTRIILSVCIVLLCGCAVAAYLFYATFYQGNTITPDRKKAYLYVPREATFEQVLDSLDANGYLIHPKFFLWAAQRENLPTNVNPGRYVITTGMSNKTLARAIAMGWQEPLNLVISGRMRTLERVSAVLTRNTLADSASMRACLDNDSLLATFGFDQVSIRGMIIPDTYEVLWTVTEQELLERMHSEYKKYWNAERTARAKEIGLTPSEVSTLAAIVYEETAKNDEMPTIAGVYMNRLRIGMPLQADPTLIFAAEDYSIRRVLRKHTKVESPYNTYKHTGLPPGPICVPSKEALEAVLHYQNHSYIYFCAKDDFSGYHNFAVSYKDHLQNARKFQKAYTRRTKEQQAQKAQQSAAQTVPQA